jgi:hypothetical protein
MSESPFTPEQRTILEPLGGLIGKVLGASVYTQIRLVALEGLLKERGILTEEAIEEANRRAEDRWRSGLMIDSLLDPDLATLLEEMRRRMQGEEPA